MSDVKINSGTANVLEFRKLVANDQALQTEIAKTVGNGSWDPAVLVKLGEANGLSFTSDDIVNNLFEEDDELSDFELEMVAAGVPQTCISGEL
jgi:hypothetical protein